jgi:hypothetical protein
MGYVRTVYRSPRTLQIIYPLIGNNRPSNVLTLQIIYPLIGNNRPSNVFRVSNNRLANARNQNTKRDILAKSGLKDVTDLSIVEGLLEITTGRRDTRILPTDARMPAGYVPGPVIDAALMNQLRVFKNNLKALQKRLSRNSAANHNSSRNSAANHNSIRIIHPRAKSNHNPTINLFVLQGLLGREKAGFAFVKELHILEGLLELATGRLSSIIHTTARIPVGYEDGGLIEAKYLRTWIQKINELQELLQKYERDQTLLKFYLQQSISSKPPPSRTKLASSNSSIPSRGTKKGNSKPNHRPKMSVPNYPNLRRLTRA